MSDALNPSLRAAVDEAAAAGTEWYRKGLPKRAIAEWRRGLALVPAPQWTHVETTWFQGNLGTALVDVGRYADARTLLREALASQVGKDNAALHVAAGVAAYELDDLDEARGYFLRALRLGGEAVFDGYDATYRDSIATVIELERSHSLY